MVRATASQGGARQKKTRAGRNADARGKQPEKRGIYRTFPRNSFRTAAGQRQQHIAQHIIEVRAESGEKRKTDMESAKRAKLAPRKKL